MKWRISHNELQCFEGGMRIKGQNLAVLFQLPARLPKLTILVAQQKFLWSNNSLCIWNIQNFSSQLSHTVWIFSGPRSSFSGPGLLCPSSALSVFNMKIWIYSSKSNSWNYFYIQNVVLNKNWNIYWSEQNFIGLGPEGRCSSWWLLYPWDYCFLNLRVPLWAYWYTVVIVLLYNLNLLT